MPHVFVIAEAGISHDGDLQKALTLIERARLAKADAVKFQTFNAKKLAERRKNPDLYEKLKKYEMPLSWLEVLKDHCDKAGIEFMTTCFDVETLEVVNVFVKRFKIGHGESMDAGFLRAHAKYGKPIIASYVGGVPRPMGFGQIPLYVTAQYPTPVSQVLLKRMRETGCDGFSDHTREVMMGSWAVAARAKIVEVHFCEWLTAWDNPDRCVSLSPGELIRYVEFIRQAESAVYGADSEETKKPTPPQSSGRTVHPPASAGSSPAGDLPKASS